LPTRRCCGVLGTEIASAVSPVCHILYDGELQLVLANATMSIAQVVSIVMRVEEEKKREVKFG
jgi:hypothetical protein